MENTKRYKCVKSFVVDKYEDDVLVENEGFEINEGATFELSKYSYMSDIRLENEGGWVELPQEALEEYFVLI